MLAIRRQAAAELADLPRPGDVESEAPAIELVPDVGDLRARPGGREPRADRIEIKAERAFEAGTFEIAVAVGGHHRLGRLKPQHLKRLDRKSTRLNSSH